MNEAHYNKLQAQYQDAQKKEGLTPEKQKKLRMIQFQMEKAKKLKEDTPDLNQVQKG